MENLTVKDLMVPLSGYATVSEDATLGEAVKALKIAQKNVDESRDKHRAILITDRNNRIVGKVSQLDVIRALEPKYQKIDEPQSLNRFGFNKGYMKYTYKEYHLWENALDDICKKAAQIMVKQIMYTPTEGEFVEDAASLNEAIHQLVMGKHQSLIVTKGSEIVGILRLTDVFREISNKISSCCD